MTFKHSIEGTITAVKARIRLLRSFDQTHHNYMGYVLVMDAEVDGKGWNNLRVTVGKKAHEKHQFRIGDQFTVEAALIEKPEQEWADMYKASKLKVIKRGVPTQERSPHMHGGIAPPLEVYRAHGHVRLDAKTYEAKCLFCLWGIVMATEILIDQWNPTRKKWRYETHCYGPDGCPNYKPGRMYQVPGRKPGMVWKDDDYERRLEDIEYMKTKHPDD